MRYAVWAPRAGAVQLQLGDATLPMRRRRGGWWELDAPAGPDYAFRLDGGAPLPDPRSPWQPHGVHGPSRPVDHAAFAWTDGGWPGRRLADMVIYELHVGTFTAVGTFDGAIDRLDHLVDLGITAVELMPVAEASGDRGWGYDGVDLWAPRQAYGGPDGLKRLVDACHARGLAVLLDVVYNHLGPEGNYLERFAPYLTRRHRTPWGSAVNFDGRGSRPVRDFVIGNALMWLRDYHLDGLRLDAVHAIVDTSPVHVLEELASRVHELGRELGRTLVVVAEKPTIDLDLLGCGVDGQWADELHHALHALLTGERAAYYRPYGSIPALAKALLAPRRLGLDTGRIVAFSQNHDQVGNRAVGERLAQLVDPGRQRLAAALVICSPFVPLLFMGEEWGATTPFLFFTDHRDPAIGRGTTEGRIREFEAFGWRSEEVPDPQDPATFLRSRLAWDERERPGSRSLHRWYRGLLRLRRETPELRTGTAVSVEHDEARGSLVMTRGPVTVRCDFRRGDVAVIVGEQRLEWE